MRALAVAYMIVDIIAPALFALGIYMLNAPSWACVMMFSLGLMLGRIDTQIRLRLPVQK